MVSVAGDGYSDEGVHVAAAFGSVGVVGADGGHESEV